MSHTHEHLLRAIFHGPMSGNIHWREVESLLGHLREYLAHARCTPSQYEALPRAAPGAT
jgi:hypothetical protein